MTSLGSKCSLSRLILDIGPALQFTSPMIAIQALKARPSLLSSIH